MYELELTITPQNKNGKWSKRNKKQRVAGFSTKSKARDYTQTAVKHACKLISCATNVYFAEVFILHNGNYIDVDTSVVEYQPKSDQIIFN